MRNSRIVALLVFLVLANAAALTAQVTGRLTGSVVDPSGAAIPDAKVDLMLPGVGRPILSAVTTADGLFNLLGIPPAAYDVAVEAPGFRKHTEHRVVIAPGRETSLRAIQLEVGAVTEEVDVSADALSVQTSNAEVSVTINKSQVKELPLLNRSPLGFVTTQAGVSSGRGATVINGQRTTYTNVTVDGINVQDNFIRTNAVDFLPNLLLSDQVAEITVATSNTNPSVGGAASQVIFVTPSGTHEFHGSAFWQNRNNAFSANTWFNNRDGIKRPFLNQNQAGGSIGGPILRDKLFFYVNYEAFRLRQQGTANRTLLTADARQGTFTYRDADGNVRKVNLLQAAGVSIDPAIAELLQRVPGPEKINNFRQGDSSESLLRNTAGYSFLLRANRTRDNVTTKLDYILSTRNTFSGSFLWNRDILDRTDLANDYSTAPKVTNDDTAKLVSLGWRWNPTPRITNELRGGFNLAPVVFATSEKFGNYIIGSTVFSNPVNTFRGQGRRTNTYSLSDNAGYVRGKHNLQFGFQFQAIRVVPFNDFGITPTYTLGIGAGNPGLTQAQLPGIGSTDLAAANNLLATLAGYITSYAQTFNITNRNSGFVNQAPNIRHYRLHNYAGYVSDSWKVRPRLALNLGLRYEYFTVVDERDALALLPRRDGGSFLDTLRSNATLDFAGKAVGRPFYGADRNNFAPNFGLAWDLFGNGKTALRVGYSVNFVNDEFVVASAAAVGTNAGLSQSVSRTGLTSRISTGLPAISVPTFTVPRTFQDNYRLNRQSSFHLPDPNLRTPYVQQWNLSIQHEWRGCLFDARYIGNHGTKLWRALDFNQVIVRENGFLADFLRAQSNGNLARVATGVFNPNYNPAIPGSRPLTIFPRLGEGGRLNNSAIRNLIEQGQVGELATTYQTQGLNGSLDFFPNPLALSTNALTNYSNSVYHAFQFDVRSRLRAGFQFQANYTFSKVLSDAASGSENAFQSRLEAFLDSNNAKIERARAPFDLAHAVKANYSYRLPMGPGHRFNVRGLGRLLDGWKTSGILTWESGTPFSVLSGRATLNRGGISGVNTANTPLTRSQLGELFRVRMTSNGPFFVGASAIGSDGRAVAPEGSQPFSGQVFFHPEAGTLGVLQRRMFSGPWVFNLDFALAKETKLTERHSLELRMDSTNIFNHPTWFVGDQTISSTTFGRIVSSFFGRRLIQFSLHYRF